VPLNLLVQNNKTRVFSSHFFLPLFSFLHNKIVYKHTTKIRISERGIKKKRKFSLFILVSKIFVCEEDWFVFIHVCNRLM